MTTRNDIPVRSLHRFARWSLAAIAVPVGPANANKDPVTPQQLKAYEDAFMEQVKKGDLLFTAIRDRKQMNVVLTTTAMACAMCHPLLRHPSAGVPKYQVSMNKFATLRDMINWCIEKPNQARDRFCSDAMKALEAYI